MGTVHVLASLIVCGLALKTVCGQLLRKVDDAQGPRMVVLGDIAKKLKHGRRRASMATSSAELPRETGPQGRLLVYVPAHVTELDCSGRSMAVVSVAPRHMTRRYSGRRQEMVFLCLQDVEQLSAEVRMYQFDTLRAAGGSATTNMLQRC